MTTKVALQNGSRKVKGEIFRLILPIGTVNGS